MTTLIERLKNPEHYYEFTDPKKANAVLMSLCQEAADALASQQEHEPENEPHVSLAPVQEPVGEVVVESMGVRGSDAMQVRMHFYKEIPPVGSKVYTTPPAAQRQWTGLTDEDVGDLSDFAYANDEEFVRNVEAKIKEKQA